MDWGDTGVATALATRAGEERPDEQLVAAVRRGDDRAFELLYSRYQRRIAGYIYRMVSDHARAEDISQEVFISALRRMRETERPIAFKPWVYEIAKNACIDQFRRSKRAEEVSFDAQQGLGASDYGRFATSDPSPHAAVAQKQDVAHLVGAFGGLSDTHHEILVMRELEGLSYREIGERLGMSRPSVESTLFRARRRLGEEYDELVTGERCRRIQAIIGSAAEGMLGVRDQRRLARHVSYCQPCRKHARLMGVDGAVLAHRSLKARIAAFIPIPAFLRRVRGGGDVGDLAGGGQGASTLAQWSITLGPGMDPVISGWTKAVAAAATIAIAGAGAGVATNEAVRSFSGESRSAAVGSAGAAGVARERSGGEVAASAGPAGGTQTARARGDARSSTDSEKRDGQGGSGSGSGSGGQGGAAGLGAPQASLPAGVPATAATPQPEVPGTPSAPESPLGGDDEGTVEVAAPPATPAAPGTRLPDAGSVPAAAPTLDTSGVGSLAGGLGG